MIAARLVAEGLQPELRGAVDGPYPFLVGGMAEVGIWVPEDQMDDASLVLLAAEVDDAVASRPRERPRWTLGAAVVAAAVLVTLVLTFLARILGTAS